MGNILTHGQISGLTNRNHIRLCMRVRLHSKSKPNNYTESCMVNVADGWRERNVWYPGRSVRNVLKGITTIGSRVLNVQKSAEVIVAGDPQGNLGEGPNQ